MTEIRKQFEALHHIESMMQLCGAEYHAITRTYRIESTGLNDREVCSFINGAWYAFQEQQKIINMQECGATEIHMILGDTEYDDATKFERIQELLK